MLAFEGTELPDDVAARLAERPVGGVGLFLAANVESPDQVRSLTDAIRAAAAAGGQAEPLIAADQEGGQLIGLGRGTTPFAGAMALGAAGDETLAERVATAMGREARALGVTIDYAPVCDLATNPANPALGIRSFGSDPAAVGRLAAATVRGLQSVGVAATIKHFPGLGAAGLDTHHGPAVVDRSIDELRSMELVPFEAAIEAGAAVAMAGHVAVPGVTGREDLPATLSGAVIHGPSASRTGVQGRRDYRRAGHGCDCPGSGTDHRRHLGRPGGGGTPPLSARPDGHPSHRGRDPARRGPGSHRPDGARSVGQRLEQLRTWAAGFAQPELDVVACAEHLALAAELAARSITVVRDDARLLPIRLPADGQIVVVEPEPRDLTPADTSSYVAPGGLGRAIRARVPGAACHVVGFVARGRARSPSSLPQSRAPTCSSWGRPRRPSFPPRRRSRDPSSRPACRRSRLPSGRRGISPRTPRRRPTSAPTGSTTPSLEALAAGTVRRGRDAGPPAGRDRGPLPAGARDRLMGLRDEILEQPDVAARLIERGWPAVERIAAAVRSSEVDFVVIAARGTSDHAAIYAQYLFGIAHGLPVALAAPSIVSLYGVRAATRPGARHRDLAVGAVAGRRRRRRGRSRPGRADRRADERRRPRSSLRAADHVIDLEAGPELSVAATKTYTAELLAIAMLSVAMAPDPERRARAGPRAGGARDGARVRAGGPRGGARATWDGSGDRPRSRDRVRDGA